MSRHQGTSKRTSLKKVSSSDPAKQNDTLFLVQNQNEVLKLKNSDIQEKIAHMKVQLAHLTSVLTQDEKQCERIRILIKQTQYTDDIRLQTQRKALQEKIAFMKGNQEIMLRKISQIRENSVLEQSKIPNIKDDKKVIERQLWQIRTQNEGVKIVLADMEKELEKCRNDNQLLVSRRKQYGPKQKQISVQIQQRIRLIKNQKNICNQLRKRQAAMLFNMFIDKIRLHKQKQAVILVQNMGLNKKILKKKIFLLSLIRTKYVLFIKNQAMQKFREKFRPLQEQKAFQRIISMTRLRRIKNRMFRTWRSEAIKKQYTTTRHFEVQNALQKITQSFDQSNLYATFNMIKYWQNNPLHQRALQIIDTVVRNSRLRCLNMFFSSLISAQNNYLNDQEVQQGAKQQSILLVTSIYFGAWAKLTKQNKTSNRILKFKYFRELKKLIAMERKRQLSEMLTIAHEKIKEIDDTSLSFCHIKKETVYGLLESLKQQTEQINQKNISMTGKIKQLLEESKKLNQTLSWLKISKHLKGRMQKAFDLWRKKNQKVAKLKIVLEMLNSKSINDKNFGFAKIQKRRFQRLKLSIADKIQSCEFSYNYLVQQNKHIKGVLDNKLLELQKSKFVKILHKLIRDQKQIKHKYFFRFLRNGYKFWRFKKIYQNIDILIQKKCKVVSFFVIKQVAKEKRREEFVERISNKKAQKIQTNLMSLCFGVFENIRNKNKKIKKILQNVFDRNGQLDVYSVYNIIKRDYQLGKQQLVNQKHYKIEEQIKKVDKQTRQTQSTIQMLRDRLAGKQANLHKRKVLAMRKFYVKNYSNKLLHYLYRWKNKVNHENKVKAFAQILQRKTRTIIKGRFVLNLFKKDREQQMNQLKTRLSNFKKQLSEGISSYEKYTTQSEERMAKMEQQNQFNQEQGLILQKKTDRMDVIKVQGFKKYWNKMICYFVLREWREHKNYFIETLKDTFEMLRMACLRYNFQVLAQQMKEQILRTRIKKNLSRAYSKKYRNNAGLAFKIWRLTNLNFKIKQFQNQYGEQVRIYNLVIQKYEDQIERYNRQVNYRIGDRKLRKIFDFLKKYTRRKLENNASKAKLQNWLKAGYQSQFFRLFYNKMYLQVYKNRKADQFMQRKPEQKMQKLFYALKTIISRKKVINRLFVKKFSHHAVFNLYEQFFARTKNYHRYVSFCKKDNRTMCIQRVIQTFEKKRKDILCQNLRRWRRNQYEMNIGKKLFKRLTRKAIYNRFQGMFYAWKLEAEAKKVLNYHHGEGQVKKRKVQILRLEKFLDDFKKQKGLLLENQEGNFVMSPRFQKKKQDQQKKDKNLRYKFISRLIMTMNGYGAPIRAYHNLQMYMKLRQRYKKTALFVLNHLRKPDLFLAFRTWRKSAADFRQSFETMQRKQLIKILNRQKDKMQIQYSHKLQVDQHIQNELQRYKVYAHQREKKQKLCGYTLMKHANKVKSHAFRTWRKRNSQLRQREMHSLANKGQYRIQTLQEEINELMQVEQEFLQTNNFLKQAVDEALSIAEMVKRISQQRDKLSKLITQKNVTCESLVEQNEVLNSRLYLAQKQAMNLLIISGQRP